MDAKQRKRFPKCSEFLRIAGQDTDVVTEDEETLYIMERALYEFEWRGVRRRFARIVWALSLWMIFINRLFEVVLPFINSHSG